MSYTENEIKVSECSKDEIIDRMIDSNLHEFDALYNYYDYFKFAFPGIKNEFLENLEETYNELLPRAISNIDSYKVLHPYPVSYQKLYESMKPIFETKVSANN